MIRTCEDIAPLVSRFVDGDLPADDLATVRGHLGGCAACRDLVADLTRIRDTARALGPIDPPPHVGLEIAGQLRLRADERGTPSAPRTAKHDSALWQWLGLAAALVVVTLGAYLLKAPAAGTATTPTATTSTTASAGNPAPTGSVEAVSEELTLAMQHYQNAIAELETITKDGQGSMDPVLAATVQRNLGAIDQAITESRGALSNEPGNDTARDSLFDALRRKISVLQATVSIIDRMSQGDQSGAARLAGMGKKS